MFIKTTNFFGSTVLVNSAYVVEIFSTERTFNSRKRTVTVLRMADGSDTDAMESLPEICKQLRAVSK